jgi:hypothetical protein
VSEIIFLRKIISDTEQAAKLIIHHHEYQLLTALPLPQMRHNEKQ